MVRPQLIQNLWWLLNDKISSTFDCSKKARYQSSFLFDCHNLVTNSSFYSSSDVFEVWAIVFLLRILEIGFFLIIRLVTNLSSAILPQLSQSSISRHNFSGTTATVARLSISHFRKGLPCSVIMVMIFATFIKSRLSPMAVWWTELYIMVWIPAYSLIFCTILQWVGAIIKYFSRACSLPMVPMKPPFIFILYVHVRCSDLNKINTIQKYPCFQVIVL